MFEADAPRKGICFVLAAPSGTGKTSLSRALLRADPNLSLSLSATTRPPRRGEENGLDYLFLSHAAFDAMLARGEFLEWAEIHGQRYGTPRDPVLAALKLGRDILFDIDWQGYRSLRAALPDDVVGIFILPPSLSELRARLEKRGDPEDEINRRMQAAYGELDHVREFDYVVLNQDFEAALRALRAIVAAERLATARQLWLDRWLKQAREDEFSRDPTRP